MKNWAIRLQGFGLMMILVGGSCTSGSAPSRKLLVAHRGASAYAPEHTLAAYQLALQQEADFVEQDLQLTRDGALICLHDESLERTTNVEDVFPDRFIEEGGLAGPVRRWYAKDFDLSEIRRLDAGSWFSPDFAGQRIPTFEEAVKLIRGRAGLFPELKAPQKYRDWGLDLEQAVVRALQSADLFEPGAQAGTPVYLQSFEASSLKRLREEFDCRLPLVLLIGTGDSELTALSSLREIARFGAGIGPDKSLLNRDAQLAARARRLGLRVFPYTFSRARLDPEMNDLSSEMAFYLFTLGVDGLFTDNPDLFPRAD